MTEPDDLERVRVEFRGGKAAYEAGEYRRSVEALERSLALANPNSITGGEVQTWLVMAYEAAGQGQTAIDLCRKLTNHPDLNTRKEAKRVLYILEAPKLKSRPEWLTQIPDLGNLTEGNPNRVGAIAAARSQPVPAATPTFKLEPVSDQVNREDNRFIWVALVVVLLVLGGLVWLS